MPGRAQKQQSWSNPERVRGVRNTALASFFLGWAPILGKLAYGQGVTPFTLAAARTLVAVILLWVGYGLFWRAYLRVTWRELAGCIAVGAVNGIGSLLYYSGLSRLDASLASFLNTLYLLWVVLFLTASGQPVRLLTLARLALAMGGVYLLTGTGVEKPDWLGAMLMMASAATYGWHLVMGQWVLADVPSRTATPYILTAMAVTVGIARVLQRVALETISLAGWGAVVVLGITTALSRILMFAGLQRLGGIEAALVSLLELLIALGLAFFLLGERLTLLQWIGGGVLVISIFLGEWEEDVKGAAG
ncbi:MAG: DMT family transporter [Anaerolineae bacterium]|nr:DMT family transporter [Anaerolineae bacterium]MDH7474560.1 DMT family transporter [Anaerolineae bacterium]